MPVSLVNVLSSGFFGSMYSGQLAKSTWPTLALPVQNFATASGATLAPAPGLALPCTPQAARAAPRADRPEIRRASRRPIRRWVRPRRRALSGGSRRDSEPDSEVMLGG